MRSLALLACLFMATAVAGMVAGGCGSSSSGGGTGGAAGGSGSGGTGSGGMGAGGAGTGGAGGVPGSALMDCAGLVCGSDQQVVTVRMPALGTMQCACVPVPS